MQKFSMFIVVMPPYSTRVSETFVLFFRFVFVLH